MSTENLLDWLGQSATHWDCLDMVENISAGGRRRLSDQDQITWPYWWFHDQVKFRLLEEAYADLGLAKGLQWLSDNSARVLHELWATPYCTSECMSLAAKVQFLAQFYARTLERIATHHQEQQAVALRQVEDRD